MAGIFKEFRVAEASARIKRKLNAIAPTAKREVLDSLFIQAGLCASRMRRFAHEKTGKTKKSIRVEEEKDKIKIRAGGPLTTKPVRKGAKATYDYANAEEFGTKEQDAEPFFYPGYRASKKDIKSAGRQAAKKAVRKATT